MGARRAKGFTLFEAVIAVALLAGGAVSLSAAAAPDLSDLPPHGLVIQALEQAPRVQAARWAVTGEEAGRDRLVAGDAETKVVLEAQRVAVRRRFALEERKLSSAPVASVDGAARMPVTCASAGSSAPAGMAATGAMVTLRKGMMTLPITG